MNIEIRNLNEHLPSRTDVIGQFRIQTFKTGLWKQNSYIVTHTSKGNMIVVDPGGRDDELIEAIYQAGGQLRLILLTHAHHDHVGALAKISKEFQIPFYFHSDDKKLLYRVPLYAMSIEKRAMTVPQNYCFLQGGEITLPEISISYIHVPGHTQGSVCFVWDKLAFTGDTLLYRRVGRTDLPGANPQMLSASIQHLLDTLAPETTMFPGHFHPWLVSEARQWWKANNGEPPQYRGEDLDD